MRNISWWNKCFQLKQTECYNSIDFEGEEESGVKGFHSFMSCSVLGNTLSRKDRPPALIGVTQSERQLPGFPGRGHSMYKGLEPASSGALWPCGTVSMPGICGPWGAWGLIVPKLHTEDQVPTFLLGPLSEL